MNEPTPDLDQPVATKPWYRKELIIFIAGSIIISLVLITISMTLYVSSGASLLDASKPGYQSVQDEVTQTDTFQAFSSSGDVTTDTITQFQQLYEKQVQPVKNSSVFDSVPLTDQALGIDDPGAAE